MSPASKDNVAYYLNYRAFDYVFIGVVLVLFSFVSAAVVFTDAGVVVRRSALLLSVMCGAGGVFCLRAGKRLREQNAWYLSFAPSQVCLNFFDSKKRGSASQVEAAILGIPSGDLIWIRKSLLRSVGDDPDKFYIDMCVSPDVWQTAKRFRNDFQGHLNTVESRPEAAFVQFFETGIIRIRLDQSAWPEDLMAHWEFCKYPAIDDYKIGHRTAINPAITSAESMR